MARHLIRQTCSLSRIINSRDTELQNGFRCFTSSVILCKQTGQDRVNEKLNQIMTLNDFFDGKQKNKEMFERIINEFERKKHKTGLVEFIKIATRRMKDYGVHEDLEMYKRLINLLPKGTMVCTTNYLADIMYYPKHQFCIIELLCHMELYRVAPDREMYTILVETFGKNARPTKKYLRMVYWGPKLKNLNPWPNPNPRPKTSQEAGILAVKRIGSVDLETEVSVFSTMDDPACDEDTWIVSGQSPTQKKLIHYHPVNVPMFVEGPFNQYLGRKDLVHYFILRSEMPKTRRRREFKNPDIIKNLNVPFFDPPTPEDLIPDFSVHEQKNEIIFAIGVTGSKSSSSLSSWIRLLQKNGNPRLAEIPILFRMKQEGEHVEHFLRLEA